MIPKTLLEKYNIAELEVFKNMFGNTIDQEIVFYQTFLIQTDHIPNKIIEKLVEDLATATLVNFLEVLFKFFVSIRTEYKEVLQYRKFAREQINTLQAEMQKGE